jgi:FkbM family methyltransferase
MSVISYAQNFEDVMLWRALRHIPQGYYVDVGANDPIVDSVTRWFYQQGWSGINIEPVPHWHQRLQVDRPRDINLQIAISTTVGRLTLYDVPDTGLSTLSLEVAEVHQQGGVPVAEMMVPSAPLDTLLAQYAGDRDIHFLKIDVEGLERDVLKSMELERFRPWIILVEATLPRSPVTNHHLWEDLLTTRGYLFAYFDGLNRFYVSAEQACLVDALKTPPNTFDAFMRYPEWQARTDNQNLLKQADHLTQQGAQLQAQIEQQGAQLQAQMEQQLREYGRLDHEHRQLLDQHGLLDQNYQKLHQEHGQLSQAYFQLQSAEGQLREAFAASQMQLDGMEKSISWRITAPLRHAKRMLNGHRTMMRHNPDASVVPDPSSELKTFRQAEVSLMEDPSGKVPAAFTDLLLHQISTYWRLADQLDQQEPELTDICCALCGYVGKAATFASMQTQCRFGGGRLQRYQCPQCDVIFGPFKMLRLNADELGREYDWHYRIFSEGDSTEQEIRAFKALDPKPGGTYLNYGAGAWSSSVRQLRAQGWNIVAYEPTGSAQNQSGLVTQRETLATLRFDGIYSNNVLEHLRYPVQDLQFLSSLLRPGARMSHATPCYEYLYEYTRFHLFFYIGRSRQLLADQACLRICSFEQDGDYMNTVYENIAPPAP